MSVDVLDIAECLNSHLPLGPTDERIATSQYVLWMGAGKDHPAHNVVQRFRLRTVDEIDAVVDEARAALRARGRPRSTWEVGPSSTPDPRAIEARLLARGMVPYEDPVAAGMVLRAPLPTTTSDIVARRCTTVEDYLAALTVMNDVFRERTESDDERRARAAHRFAEECERADPIAATFLGVLDGEVVAAAITFYVDGASVLCGGATLERARGRGAYRALLRARYDDAVARGAPTLVVQAGPMSRPILARLGFDTLCEVRILLDAPP